MIKRLSQEAIIDINPSVTTWGHALLDRPALEAAANQPFTTWGGLTCTRPLLRRLPCCAEIAFNHPFQDGNERTAWPCRVELLSLNGAPLDYTRIAPIQAAEMVLSLVKHEIDLRYVACGKQTT